MNLNLFLFYFASISNLFNYIPNLLASPVIGGTEDSNNFFKFHVSIQINYTPGPVHKADHYCGGAIISDRYVLSAATSFIDKIDGRVKRLYHPGSLNMIVLAGSSETYVPGLIAYVINIFIPHEYNVIYEQGEQIYADIAVLKLQTGLILELNSFRLRAIPLDKRHSAHDYENQNAFTMGNGCDTVKIGDGGVFVDHPEDFTAARRRFLEVKMLDRQHCRVFDRSICAENIDYMSNIQSCATIETDFCKIFETPSDHFLKICTRAADETIALAKTKKTDVNFKNFLIENSTIYNEVPNLLASPVVGGTEDIYNDFKYHVSIQINYTPGPVPTADHYCGGAIISDRYVLSAATSFIDKIDGHVIPFYYPRSLKMIVLAGTSETHVPGLIAYVINIFIPHAYNVIYEQGEQIYADIAVLKLEADLNLALNSHRLRAISLDEGRPVRDYENQNAFVMGTGCDTLDINANGVLVDHPQEFTADRRYYLEVKMLDRHHCPVFGRSICAESVNWARIRSCATVKSLDGFWDFLVPPANDVHRGHLQAWYMHSLSKAGEVMQMPVPSSYNDITTSRDVRDHVGPVWYEKTFYVPPSWVEKRVFLRFGSVNYSAQVWLNGNFLMSHEMGHLPFEVEVTSAVLFGGKNRVTIAVDNILLQTSVPQGKIMDMETDNGTIKVQTYTFDFFNYAGIHRPVLLHTKPKVFIEDVIVNTEVINGIGIVGYKIDIAGLRPSENYSCDVNLIDADNKRACKSSLDGKEGVLKVLSPKLWWPRSMSDNPGYLYTLEITLTVTNTGEQDLYRLPIGIRSLKWTETCMFINDKPIYFRGFGRHEDSSIRGRGLDLPTVARDHELLKWLGANAYRTSHYPYSDEVLDVADRLGFLVINECPSVDTVNFSPRLLERHRQSLSELIRRDKNRPSVVMWSIANEPKLSEYGAELHFKHVAYHTKRLDSSRPITMAIATPYDDNDAAQYIDIISFNRYNAWYSNPGRTNMITKNIVAEAQNWHIKYKKPVLISEYGADTISGLHELPEYVWSEEYQMEIMSKHFKAFDQLRVQGFFIGEFIWNFADFRTAQTYTRVGGNKKGIFTRDRQPKMVAHHVRKRYRSLSIELDKAKLFNNIDNYIYSYCS